MSTRHPIIGNGLEKNGSSVDPLAVIIVLVAAGFHAGWNRILHDTSDRVATMAIAGLASGVVLLPVTIATAPRQVVPLIVLSALAETAYALSLSAAYRRGAMALAYPIGRGAAPLLVTLGGWLILVQRPTPETVAASVALIAGLVLVATAGQHKQQRAAIGFALLVGVCIASYSLIDASAVRQVSPVGYLGAVMLLQGALLTLCARGDRLRLRKALVSGLFVAVGSTAAYLLVLLAFQRAEAGRVATLREISVLLGVLIARERSGPRVWLGAGLVVLGAVLAAL